MHNNKQQLLYYPEVLLIAGQSQNVGKTTLASRIIAHFTWTNKIAGIKVTPHFHKNTGNALAIEKTTGYHILRETTPDSNKDTSIMLQAGAEEAFLLEAEPECLAEGFKQVMKYIPEGNMVVCESAGLSELIQPGVFLMLQHQQIQGEAFKNHSLLKHADRIVTFTNNGFDFPLDELSIDSGTWNLT